MNIEKSALLAEYLHINDMISSDVESEQVKGLAQMRVFCVDKLDVDDDTVNALGDVDVVIYTHRWLFHKLA